MTIFSTSRSLKSSANPNQIYSVDSCVFSVPGFLLRFVYYKLKYIVIAPTSLVIRVRPHDFYSVCICVYAIAGKTAVPNWLIFFEGTHGPFPGQSQALQLVYLKILNIKIII